jgi:hypothetical protein
MIEPEVKKYNSYEEIENKIVPSSFQRGIILSAVREIKDYLRTTPLPRIGVIDLAKYNGQLYCIDGNHRLTALKEMYESSIIRPFFCIIYTVNSIEEMESIFKIRNHSQPIPNFIIHPPEDKGLLLRLIFNFLQDKPLVKNVAQGTKCNRPFINVNKFMEYVEDSQHLPSWENLSQFEEFFFHINEKIRRLSLSEDWRKRHKVTENMLTTITEKCTNSPYKIYIGLYSNYDDFDSM